MSIKDKYTVKPIDSYLCHEWCLKKHYAKRIPPIEYSFGLFCGHILSGIVTYGTPASSNLRSAWYQKYKLLELNRLVLDSTGETNALSYLVSCSLRLLPKPLVVVSYADTSMGHHGYIYQATNWVYTGLSAKRTDWTISGMEHLHGATIADMSRGKENRAEFMRETFGDRFYLRDRPRKHRYFYFIGSKKDKKIMSEMLPYKIEPYPKGENKRYDASYRPPTQTELF